MFDLILDKVDRPYRRSAHGATVVSIVAHVVMVTVVLVIPLLYVTNQLPPVPVIVAFVAPPPPPPPPPPAAVPAPRPSTSQMARSSPNPNAAPIEAPAEIKPETRVPPGGGQVGGVEGGIEGGVAGGIVGGLITEAPPPPPPPPPPPIASPQPVRIGGQVVAPALLTRVEPEYPAIAVAAHVEGLVILETVVDSEGRVQDVKVLQSRGFLDKAAIEAVKQWRYAPLTLNGVNTPFVLTVTLNFALRERSQHVG